jgi:hypothetical protein
MTMRELIRDFWIMLPSQLRTWGPFKGWKMAWLWAQYGREERTR